MIKIAFHVKPSARGFSSYKFFALAVWLISL